MDHPSQNHSGSVNMFTSQRGQPIDLDSSEVPLSQNHYGYVNMLMSQGRVPIELGSSDFPQTQNYVPPSQTQPGSSHKPKPLERRKWSPKEDIVLISAWLNTSKDPIVSNEQKATAFWKRIEQYYNASEVLVLGGFPTRDSSQCKQRWGRMNGDVGKFVGTYEAALKEQSSGQSENDVMQAAHDMFLTEVGYKFVMEHAWRELRFEQKWKTRGETLVREGAKDKRKEADEETVPDASEVRPPGVKACKAGKRKKHGQEAAYDQLESILEVKEKISRQRLLERLLASKDPLSDLEVCLKNKLLAEML